MTLDEAKQKILDRVLAVSDDVTVVYKDLYSDGGGWSATYARATIASFPEVSVVHKGDSVKPPEVAVQQASNNKVNLITSNEYPQLLEWWNRAVKQSAEQRVIQFAESLP